MSGPNIELPPRVAVKLGEALIEKAKAEAEEARANARNANVQADMDAISLAGEKRTEERLLAADQFHKTYVFSGAVSKDSVKTCIDQLTVWHRNDPSCDLTLVFDSPGGSVIDGMHLFDFLLMLRESGHQLTTVALGYAASMAGILLQAGDVRKIGRESYLHLHEISFGAGGKLPEVEDEVTFAKKITKRVLRIYAARSNLSERQIANRWARREWWMDSTEALKHGFVDSILADV